jgi:hypothetical protein
VPDRFRRKLFKPRISLRGLLALIFLVVCCVLFGIVILGPGPLS